MITPAWASLLWIGSILLTGRLGQQAWKPTCLEAVTSATAVGTCVGLATSEPSFPLVAVPLALVGPVATFVDAREGRLPDVLTVTLLGATLVAASLAGSALTAISMAVIAGGLGAGVAALAPRTFGWGDAKLVPSLTVVLGCQGRLPEGVVTGAILIAVTAMVVGMTGERGIVPYGPALVFGTLAAVAAG